MLIVIDGPSGSGKDSLIKGLKTPLAVYGIPVFLFNEEKLDNNRGEILAAKKSGGDIAMTQALIQHRQELYETYVSPRLKQGHLILANRGETATEAYQTSKGEISMEEVWQQHRNAGIPIPDLVIITTCKPETALARIESDNQTEGTGRKEQEEGTGLSWKITHETDADGAMKLEKQTKIHDQYRILKEFLESKQVRVIMIDSESQTVEKEVQNVLGILQ